MYLENKSECLKKKIVIHCVLFGNNYIILVESHWISYTYIIILKKKNFDLKEFISPTEFFESLSEQL